jgi:hypothetical protein
VPNAPNPPAAGESGVRRVDAVADRLGPGAAVVKTFATGPTMAGPSSAFDQSDASIGGTPTGVTGRSL